MVTVVPSMKQVWRFRVDSGPVSRPFGYLASSSSILSSFQAGGRLALFRGGVGEFARGDVRIVLRRKRVRCSARFIRAARHNLRDRADCVVVRLLEDTVCPALVISMYSSRIAPI